ncbi:hypothetical protein HY994_05790 [Candidatus Micrarchaeota archaeon]|nr:hypothetical protein [Candidatus Micrarchaeota archaeon]
MRVPFALSLFALLVVSASFAAAQTAHVSAIQSVPGQTPLSFFQVTATTYGQQPIDHIWHVTSTCGKYWDDYNGEEGFSQSEITSGIYEFQLDWEHPSGQGSCLPYPDGVEPIQEGVVTFTLKLSDGSEFFCDYDKGSAVGIGDACAMTKPPVEQVTPKQSATPTPSPIAASSGPILPLASLTPANSPNPSLLPTISPGIPTPRPTLNVRASPAPFNGARIKNPTPDALTDHPGLPQGFPSLPPAVTSGDSPSNGSILDDLPKSPSRPQTGSILDDLPKATNPAPKTGSILDDLTPSKPAEVWTSLAIEQKTALESLKIQVDYPVLPGQSVFIDSIENASGTTWGRFVFSKEGNDANVLGAFEVTPSGGLEGKVANVTFIFNVSSKNKTDASTNVLLKLYRFEATTLTPESAETELAVESLGGGRYRAVSPGFSYYVLVAVPMTGSFPWFPASAALILLSGALGWLFLEMRKKSQTEKSSGERKIEEHKRPEIEK